MKMSNEQKLSFYKNILNKFSNPTIKIINEEIIKNTPIIFFGASTSSTGKYHPKATNGVMGLVKHSIAVMLIAEDLLSNDTIMKVYGLSNITKTEKEIILSACLLHDNAKYGSVCAPGVKFNGYTQSAHPILVTEIAQKAGLYDKLTGENLEILNKVINLIETHMGQWTVIREGGKLPAPQSKAQAFVHTCDYVASKKTLDIVSEFSFPEGLDPEVLEWYEELNAK